MSKRRKFTTCFCAQEAWHKRYDPAGPQPRSWEELMDPDAPRFAERGT